MLTNQIFNRLKVRHMQFMINKTQLITNNKNNNHRLFNYTYKVIWMSDFVMWIWLVRDKVRANHNSFHYWFFYSHYFVQIYDDILEIYENYNMLKICCNVLVMVGLFSCVFGDSEDVVLVSPLVKISIFWILNMYYMYYRLYRYILRFRGRG